MDFDDGFDFLMNDVTRMSSTNELEDDFFDFPFCHSTPGLVRTQKEIRPLDFPSVNKHYGLISLFNHEVPIIYRLLNDTLYVPYIRFSFALNIVEGFVCEKFFVDIRNLPVLEMTVAEKVYYDELCSSSNCSDWSCHRLLSVSVLDGVLSIINLTNNSEFKANMNSVERLQEVQTMLSEIRQGAQNRWILEEKFVLTRLTEKQNEESTCISSNSVVNRRSLVEKRMDLSIVDEAGGFIQIDSFVYPCIKNRLDGQIYINLNDIRRNSPLFLLPHMSSSSVRSSAMHGAYKVVAEQAQSNYEWNIIHHGRNNELSKVLPSIKRVDEDLSDELPFIPLEAVLRLLSLKDSKFTQHFVQLFESSSLNEIESNYKNNIGREFIMDKKRQSGFINGILPCLVFSQVDRQSVWIPSETQTQRAMSNDERLYLNVILLYRGLWKNILTRQKQWFLKEVDDHSKENVNLEIVSATV